MGGTDLFDQFGSYYRSTLKSVKWHIRLFSHFFVAACINANILYQGKVAARNSDTQLKFMERIIEQWSGFEATQEVEEEEGGNEEETVPEVVAPSKRTNSESREYRNQLNNDWQRRVNGIHAVQYVSNNDRGWCIVCQRKSKTRHMCLECNVYCHISGEIEDNCWHKLHTHRNF